MNLDIKDELAVWAATCRALRCRLGEEQRIFGEAKLRCDVTRRELDEAYAHYQRLCDELSGITTGECDEF